MDDSVLFVHQPVPAYFRLFFSVVGFGFGLKGSEEVFFGQLIKLVSPLVSSGAGGIVDVVDVAL